MRAVLLWPAPRARGDGPSVIALLLVEGYCSPRPRGWTLHHRPGRRHRPLLPAPAGMDPAPPGTRPPPGSAPRARGDGPKTIGPTQVWTQGLCSPRPRGWTRSGAKWGTAQGCSPRPRGWTRAAHPHRRTPPLLPAPAGMDPSAIAAGSSTAPAPRARGDGPTFEFLALPQVVCSPRPRGWTTHRPRPPGHRRLLPAPAGMDPRKTRASLTRAACSPRPRGWTPDSADGHPRQGLLPAPAGMDPRWRGAGVRCGTAPRARGDGPHRHQPGIRRPNCSPRPRGWTLVVAVEEHPHALLPAPAGMDPPCTSRPADRAAAPRARGDGPNPKRTENRSWTLLPAPAGMDPPRPRAARPADPAPRARGDGPGLDNRRVNLRICSPRPRGWTQMERGRPRRLGLLPAPAGMDPTQWGNTDHLLAAPRARGDGPKEREAMKNG